jgi:hypothetical protein
MTSYIVKNILLVIFSTVSGLGIGLTVFELINSITPLILGPLIGFASGAGIVSIINAINNSRMNDPVHSIHDTPIQNKDLLSQKIYFNRNLESILKKKSIQFVQVECVNNINSPPAVVEKMFCEISPSSSSSAPLPSAPLPSAPEDPCV